MPRWYAFLQMVWVFKSASGGSTFLYLTEFLNFLLPFMWLMKQMFDIFLCCRIINPKRRRHTHGSYIYIFGNQKEKLTSFNPARGNNKV